MRLKYILVSGFLFTLFSCGKNPETTSFNQNSSNNTIVQPGKLILNGDGWYNAEFSWDNLYHDSLYNIAYYIVNTGQTKIVKITNALYNPYAVVSIKFNGFTKSSTSFSNACLIQFQLVYTGNRANTIYYSANAKGTLNITRFENVGGYIEGNFSGTFINKDTGTEIRVESGQFSEKRSADK